MIVICPNCGYTITTKDEREQEKTFLRTGYYLCPQCKKLINAKTCHDEILAKFHEDELVRIKQSSVKE